MQQQHRDANARNPPDTPQTVTQVSRVGSFARLPSFFSSRSDVHTRSHTNGESSSPLLWGRHAHTHRGCGR